GRASGRLGALIFGSATDRAATADGAMVDDLDTAAVDRRSDLDITNVVAVEVAERQRGQSLGPGAEKVPRHLAAAREPPGLAGGHEVVGDAVAVEVAVADLTCGIRVEDVARQERLRGRVRAVGDRVRLRRAEHVGLDEHALGSELRRPAELDIRTGGVE